jgi:C4-dicarboxylate transporter DctM subunit
MTMNHIICLKRGYFFKEGSFSIKRVLVTFFKSIGALIMPFIIIGGIISGIFTATEAGVVAVVYGFFFGTLITRALKLHHIPKLLINSATTSAMVMYIIAMCMIFSNILSRLRFQEMVVAQVLGISHDPTLAVIFIIALLLFLGCFIDPTALIVMFATTLAALGNQLGYHPIHFGVMIIIVMLIGAVTPPVGSMLFVSLGIAKIPLEESVGVLYPFISVLVIVAFIVLLVPQTVTWIPGLIFG